MPVGYGSVRHSLAVNVPRTSIIRLWVSREEKNAVTAAANESQQTISDWCRNALGAALLEQMLHSKEK